MALCARQPRTQQPSQTHVSSSALPSADNRLQFPGVRAWASSDPRTRKISKKTSDKIPKKILQSSLGSSRHQDLGAWTSRQSMFAMVISICAHIYMPLFRYSYLCNKYKYSYSIRYLISHYIVTMNIFPSSYPWSR